MSEKRYDVFLSYSSKDRAWVKEFSSALRDAGAETWFDVGNIMPGEQWQEKLEEALRESRTLVVILSPNSVDSPWTFFELGAAVADNKRIIPVMAQDVDMARIPMLLRRYQFLREPSPLEAGRRVAEVLEQAQAA